MTEEDAVYRILDTLVDALGHVTERVEVRVDALEAAVLARVEPAQVEAIYRLKQEVRDIERRTFQQHARFDGDIEAILALEGFQAGQRRYLNDVRDHLEQASGALTRQLEDLHMLTGTFYNANAQKLNVSVARLSILAAFFLVWTLVTSFFGQNFGWLVDNIDSRTDFLVYGVGGLVASTLVAAAILWWRRRDLL
jgi:magnesium transporter